MQHTYLSVAGTSLKLVKSRGRGVTTFTGEYNVGDVTYSVGLSFVFADNTFAYTVMRGEQVVYEREGFASKGEAKSELKDALEILTSEDTQSVSDEASVDVDEEDEERELEIESTPEVGIIATGVMSDSGQVMTITRTSDGKFHATWIGSNNQTQTRRFNTEVAVMSYFNRRTASVAA